MLTLLKTKLALILIGALAVTGVTGTAAVVAAHQHVGLFANGNLFGTQTSHSHGDINTDKGTPTDANYHAQGIIQSVTLGTDSTSGTLTLLPNGTSTVVTVDFTAQTHIEIAADSEQKNPDSGAAGLKAGLFANVVGTLQPDKTVLAKEIQANANGKAHQGGNTPTPTPGDGHKHANGTPTPTPGDGHGHQNGTPTPTPGS